MTLRRPLAGPTVAEAMARPSNGFALVRLLLAAAVVMSHAFSLTSGNVGDEPLIWTGYPLGGHAVNGFFAISGFLVALSFERRGWRDYAVARLLRIVPGLAVAGVSVVLGLGAALTTLPATEYWRDPAVWRFLAGLFTTFKTNASLPGVFADNPVRIPMGTVWTLKYELWCYLAVFAAGLAGLLRSRWPATVLGAALFLAILWLEPLDPAAVTARQTTLRLSLLFVIGVAVCGWRDRLRLSWLCLAGAVIVTWAFARTPAYHALLLATEAYGTLVVALAPALARPVFDLRADLSYGIYLYGWPIQQTLRHLVPDSTATTVLIPSLAISAAVAAVSWYGVEKPALVLKARALGRSAIRTTEPAAP